MTDDSLLEGIRRAIEQDPSNGALHLHYADLLAGAERVDQAIDTLRNLSRAPEWEGAASRKLVPLLRRTGQLSEALIRAEALLRAKEDPEIRAELEAIERERAADPMPVPPPAPPPERAPQTSETREENPEKLRVRGGDSEPDEDWASQFDWGDLHVTFADVAGLDDVKRQVRLRIIAPFQQPEIYDAFGREAGGGVLLYGPPGCGKTYMARATAGELKASFVAVSIHQIVDQYFGQTEKLIHDLFVQARSNKPTVLFFDEFDALGAQRGRSESQFWKTMVDQLLQEMDGIEGRNTDVLLFAATNTPWNVDPAFRRPGRFDRVLFVPPPDEDARMAILQRHARKLPGGEEIALEPIAAQTDLFTGADVKHLCERAAERALDRSLSTGKVHEVDSKDFDQALKDTRSSAREWFASARNFARYSNEGGQYDELVDYLKAARLW